MGLTKLKSNLAAFKTGDSEFSAISTVNYFDDFNGGAKGFVTKANDVNKSYFIGISANNDKYTYPSNVKGNRLMNPNKSIQFPGPQNYFNDNNSGAKGFTNNMYPIGGSKQDSQFLGINGNTYTYSDTLVNKWKDLNLRNDATNVYQSFTDQPLILRGMQRPGELNSKPQRWGFGIGFDDGLIRGGAVTAAERAAIDTERIAKWMASPKGLLWIVKQAGLGLSNPNVETAEGANFPQTQIRTGVDTLLSVAGNATGLHFPSFGIPFATEAGKYEYVQKSLLGGFGWEFNNRLAKLTKEINSTTIAIGQAFTTLSSNNKIIGRGAQSVYGIGSTPIKRVVSTTNLETSDTRAKNYPDAKTDGINNYITLAYGKIPPRNDKSFRDFRADIASNGINNERQAALLGTGQSQDYYDQNNLETKYGLGKLGDANLRVQSGVTERGKDSFIIEGIKFDKTFNKDTDTRKILVVNDKFRGDRITGLNIGDVKDENEIYNQNDRDFITFYFEDGNVNTNVMPFRATITGLTDTFTPGWEKKDIMGRPDGVYQYNSFERSISFEFKVYALSRSEMIPMWRKLNYLASYTMPDYNGNRPSGPMMRLTLGDMYYKAPGFISSLSYTIPDEGSWDIADDFDALDNPDAKQLPMYVDVSVGYTIIGRYRPRLMGRVYPLSIKDSATVGAGQWLNSQSPAPIKEPAQKPTANVTKDAGPGNTGTEIKLASAGNGIGSQFGAPVAMIEP